MPKRILRSATHAYAGLAYALRTERNLRLFGIGYTCVIALMLFLPLAVGEWISLLLAGGAFMSVELLNTGLERLADVMDDHCKSEHRSHCYVALKHTKDVAAAASLVSFVVVVMVILLIIVSHREFLLHDTVRLSEFLRLSAEY